MEFLDMKTYNRRHCMIHMELPAFSVNPKMNSKRPASSKSSRKEVRRPKATTTIQKKVELLDMLREKRNSATMASVRVPYTTSRRTKRRLGVPLH
ncbi:hypothetical protein M514_14978 [Trichuris suis]|uniref:Uncharacterized protein n=1 Tax=Trichuris suis TaxID=68888 RepID=A0A085NUC8_9BILA|nr:hypothetical protein M514_14978 [Trichuris suis]